MRESDIESWSVKYARQRGWWARKFRTMHRRSAPDFIFGKNGVVFWVEFKATGEPPTELQADEHTDMRAHGLTVYVCDSRETFPRMLEEQELKWLEA